MSKIRTITQQRASFAGRFQVAAIVAILGLIVLTGDHTRLIAHDAHAVTTMSTPAAPDGYLPAQFPAPVAAPEPHVDAF